MKTTSPKPLLRDPRPQQHLLNLSARRCHLGGLSSALVLALTVALSTPVLAADPASPAARAPSPPTAKPATSASAPKTVAEQLREAVAGGAPAQKRLSLVINGKEKKYITMPAPEKATPAQAPGQASDNARSPALVGAATSMPPPMPTAAPPRLRASPESRAIDSRAYIRAKAAALGGHAAVTPVGTPAKGDPGEGGYWRYQGETGPQAWGRLKPEFNLCAIGKRQSPINIDQSATLQGPAEPLQFHYQPSSGSVVNNGHTIQIDIEGNNSLTVRGSSFKLLQFHFHHPAEERVDGLGFAMVVHLVHQNAEGQLAVVAVLLDPGAANALIGKVWTHMPLDTGDRVRLPSGLIDMNELLPKDQRYYQFMGSLTTPPCSEGVLWLVLKQPTSASAAQIRMFSQLFPNNARPVQPLHGRAVRDAQ